MRAIASLPRACGAAVLIGTLTLAGCGGLPTDDTPRQGEPVLGQPKQVIQVRPEGPQQSANPEQIVRGFLLANLSFADSHEVARAYLTEELASSWVPTNQVLIHTSDYDLSPGEEGVIDVTATMEGVLDAEGELTPLPQDTIRTESFTLEEVKGQWRISAFPADFGLWLSSTAFEAQFRTASVNYLSSGRDRLVPQTRWFSREEGLPTALARALLAPLPAYLDGAVLTGVAAETNLVGGAVPVDPGTGVATVNLQGPGLTEEPDQVRALYAQFTSTLLQAGGVRAVEIQINGQSLEVPGVRAPVTSLEGLDVDPVDNGPEFAVLRVGETLTAVDPGYYALRNLSADLQEALDLPSVAESWTDVALDATAQEFAAVDSTRGVLWRRTGGVEVERHDIGEDLSPPTFDRDGSLWVAGLSATGPQVWAIDSALGEDALARPMDADWLEAGAQIDAFTVAPDGQRAAIVIRSDDAQTLSLTGIVRDQEGDPTGLTPPKTITTTLTSLHTVSWASQESLVVLGQDADDEVDSPYQVPLGSWLQPLATEPGAVDFLGVPASDGFDLFLVTDEGRVYTPEGAGWYSYRNGDDLIVPPG